MIVLRITTGQTSQEVRTDRTDVVLGSNPTADITLQHAGLPDRAVRLRRRGTELDVEILGTDRKVTMRVGDEIEVGTVSIELAGLLPQGDGTAPIFGGYDDDPTPTGPRTGFELADTQRPSRHATSTRAPASTPSLPRADQPAAGVRASAGRPRPRPQPNPAAARAAPAALAEAARKDATQNLKPLKFPEPDFGAELVAQLKRSPFFVMSLAVHVLIFFILSLLISTTAKEPVRDGPGSIIASMQAEEEELGHEVDELEIEGLPQPESPLPDLEAFIDPEEAPPPEPKPQRSPFEREMKELEDLDRDVPIEIGIMPGLRAAANRPRNRLPKMPKVELKRDFTKGAAGSSNQRSAEIVRGALGRGRFGNGAKLSSLEKDDVLVVDGSFDHIERVLDALQIQYVKKSTWYLATPKPEDFAGYKVVFWNCGERLGKRHIQGVAKRLREFVRNGGYLFTTDWGIANILTTAFPGYLKTTGNRAHLPEMTLPIEPADSAREHPLLEGVFLPGVRGKWWLENASFDILVGRQDKVSVLIESPMLKSSFNRSPIVAATFHYGRGRVLHAMGHYYQEAGNLAGTIAAHRLALNFVLMRLDQDKR